MVVKNEGGGEGLNKFLLLKKGGLRLLKRGIIERVPLRKIYVTNTKHITRAVIHQPATLATYWGGLIPASSSANSLLIFLLLILPAPLFHAPTIKQKTNHERYYSLWYE